MLKHGMQMNNLSVMIQQNTSGYMTLERVYISVHVGATFMNCAYVNPQLFRSINVFQDKM